MQATVATSSTEAGFITAIHATKLAKSLCSILEEPGFSQDGPMPLYKDNLAAIAMINQKNKPTSHSHHIDIQYFAIQKW